MLRGKGRLKLLDGRTVTTPDTAFEHLVDCRAFCVVEDGPGSKGAFAHRAAA